MKRPLVSIIVLNYNGSHDTNKCLQSIALTTYLNYEVILIDNGSSDNSDLVKRTSVKNLHYYKLNKNLGFTGGNNFGLKKCRGKYVAFLNNDAVVDKRWLAYLVKAAESDSSIAVLQPKILKMDERNRFDYAGAAGGFIDKYGYPFTRGRIFETEEIDQGQYDNQRPIFWASGAAMMVRKSVINKVGGLFDESFFNYMEEIDFCWRVWRRGFQVVSCPRSMVYHKGAATASKNLFLKRYWEHRNNLMLLAKNIGGLTKFSVLVNRVPFELLTYFYYFIGLKWSFIFSLAFAHGVFLLHLPKYIGTGSKNLDEIGAPVLPKSIVVEYFIKNNKWFSSLRI